LGQIVEIFIQSDNKIVVNVQQSPFNTLYRLNTDGTEDYTFLYSSDYAYPNGWRVTNVFNNQFYTKVGMIEIGNYIYIGNKRVEKESTTSDGYDANFFFNINIKTLIKTLDNKILAGGNKLIKYTSEGVVDPSFSVLTVGNGKFIFGMVENLDGSLYIYGNFNMLNGVDGFYGIAKINPDGTVSD